MNLIEILTQNGTGLLEGFCRPTQSKSFKHLLDGNDQVGKIEISFSLNEKNLGKYECEIEDNNDNYTALSVSLRVNDTMFILIDINVIGSLSFAKFQASVNY